MNAKAVQVIVVTAHEQPDDPVQVRDRQAVRKLDPAPDRGMNTPQEELLPQQQRRALFNHHPDHSSPHPALPPFCDGLPPGMIARPARKSWLAGPSPMWVRMSGMRRRTLPLPQGEGESLFLRPVLILPHMGPSPVMTAGQAIGQVP